MHLKSDLLQCLIWNSVFLSLHRKLHLFQQNSKLSALPEYLPYLFFDSSVSKIGNKVIVSWIVQFFMKGRSYSNNDKDLFPSVKKEIIELV